MRLSFSSPLLLLIRLRIVLERYCDKYLSRRRLAHTEEITVDRTFEQFRCKHYAIASLRNWATSPNRKTKTKRKMQHRNRQRIRTRIIPLPLSLRARQQQQQQRRQRQPPLRIFISNRQKKVVHQRLLLVFHFFFSFSSIIGWK